MAAVKYASRTARLLAWVLSQPPCSWIADASSRLHDEQLRQVFDAAGAQAVTCELILRGRQELLSSIATQPGQGA